MLLLGAAACLPSSGATILSDGAAVACAPVSEQRLHCDYRLKGGGTAIGATLASGEVSVPAARLEPFTAGTDTTAILILVDTSDPGRQAVMSRYAEHIGRLLALATPQRRFGLASFDADLVVLDPVGATPDAIESHARKLRATGMTTELYRNAIEAVKRLAAVPAARRELVMLSDGLAEDTAYHHEDTVRAAHDADVVISAIGYPRSTALAVGMQTLRRLAEDTGGMFVAAAGPQGVLDPAVFPAMLGAAESGGTLEFKLDDLAAALPRDADALSLELATAHGPVKLVLPVPLARAAPTPAAPVPPAAPAARSAAPAAPQAAGAPDDRERMKRKEFVPPRGVGWPIAMATPVILILGIAWGLIIMARRRRAAADAPLTQPAGAEAPPVPLPFPSAPRSHAFLIAANAPHERHAIGALPFRIGRSRNNDLVLEDRSVSRLHAEIRLDEQGRYLLRDLQSANGVFVNDERVDSAVLEEGARVEIGEVALRFTCHDEDYEAQEPTIMIRTRTPG